MPVASWFYLAWYGPDAFSAQDDSIGDAAEMSVGVSYDVRVVADAANSVAFAYVGNGTRIGSEDIGRALDAVALKTTSDVRTISDPSNLSPGELADGVGSIPIEGGLNLTQAIRLILASAANKVSGAETGTIRFRDHNDTKDRIVATVDSNGNRSAVTKDVS